jgi:hypothetical protein
MRRFFLLICILLISFAPDLKAQTGPAAKKKLIEFGWDEPDTGFMRQHIAAMEQMPFDGTVFHANYSKPDGSAGAFVWECWGKRAFTEPEFQQALQDLRNTPIRTFTHNFLRFNVAPGDVDWFDDFTAITNNARLAAKIAREGKAAGVLFDIEEYTFRLFDYRKQKQRDAKSWDDYAQQARRRGREVMAAFQEGYPDLVIFLTYGHSLPSSRLASGKAKLADVDYGLLAPFLDGMFDAAAGKSKIVDGYELSYGFKEARQFDEVPMTIKRKVMKIVETDPAKFATHSSLGFGLWMDNNWRKNGWNEKDFSQNYFTPEQFQQSVSKALDTADEYVWIYTETPRWWTLPDGLPTKLPEPYVDALRRARAEQKR